MSTIANPPPMTKYEIKELGIKEPNLLVIVKADDVQYAFPVHKESLACHSTVFADMLSLSKKKEDQQDHRNGWVEPYNDLETVSLEDKVEDVEYALRHLFSESALPFKFGNEEALAVYKLADKYAMQRLCDWMKDKLLPEMDRYGRGLLIRVCEAASNAGDTVLQTAVARAMSQCASDWHIALVDGVYCVGEGYTRTEDDRSISISCAGLIMHTCLAKRNGTAYNVYKE